MRRAWGLLFVLFSLLAVPAQAEWRRAESPNFVLYGTQSEAALRQRILLLEDFDRLLRTITSINERPSPNRLHIYLVDNARQLQAIRSVPRGVAGFYTATPEGIAAIVDRSSEMSNHVLFHEYAHHFMLQYRPNAYPAWYIEGFAEYFATVRFTDDAVDIGDFNPGRAYAITSAPWLPMERILFGTSAGLSREQINQYYAQSWLLIHYFYSNAERQATLLRYLGAARRDDPAAALASATGLTAEQLTEELRNYIRGNRIRFRRMSRAAGQTAPAVTFTTLTPGAEAVMTDAATLRIGVGESYQAAALTRLRAAAARFPADPFVMRTQAHAEALFGDGATADRLLNALLAAQPNDAELMYLRGRRLLAAPRAADAPPEILRSARQWFSRAHRADENHFQTLYRYAETFRGERDYLSENTGNVLVLAHQLAPQVSEIRMNAAAQLLQRGQRDDAARLLEPLAADPHNETLARAAAQLLTRARDGRAIPRPAPERD